MVRQLIKGLFTAFFLSGCSFASFIEVKLNSSTSSSTELVVSASQMKLLESKPLEITGGTAPFNYEVIQGEATVSSDGIVEPQSTRPAKIKVTDAKGKIAIVDINPTEKENLTGMNVKAIKFSQDKQKAVITTEISSWSYAIYSASFNPSKSEFTNLKLVSTAQSIPNLNKACSFAQIHPNGSKIIFSADTSPGGNADECELWIIDFDGQNGLMLSEELSPAGGSGNRSVTSERFSYDGTRILYLDGEDPAFVDNELALKVVNLDGTGRTRLHPTVASDWGVTAFQEVPGANRVLFNHNNPNNYNNYRTYTARMDGSDSGALVPASATTGSVGIGQSGTLFDNNSKIFFYDSKTIQGTRTIEFSNVDGTGKVIVENVGGGSVTLLYASPTATELIYAVSNFALNSLIVKKYSSVSGMSTILSTTHQSIQQLMVKNGYLYYFFSAASQLRRIGLDGTGDTLISQPGIAGRVHNFYVLPNNDVFFVAEKDVLYVSELFRYKFSSGQTINISPKTFTIGSVFARWSTVFLPMGSNALSVQFCPGNQTIGGGCQVPFEYFYFSQDEENMATYSQTGLSSSIVGTELSSGQSSKILLSWGTFGIRTQWFGF